MGMPKAEPHDPVYEDGWLDAFARRNPKMPFHDQPARYRDGYVAGQRDRKDTDRGLAKLAKK